MTLCRAASQCLGHDDRYYQAVDQRFLDDEKFIGQIAERAPKGDITRRAEAAI
jgi:hypothetical protein